MEGLPRQDLRGTIHPRTGESRSILRHLPQKRNLKVSQSRRIEKNATAEIHQTDLEPRIRVTCYKDVLGFQVLVKNAEVMGLRRRPSPLRQ